MQETRIIYSTVSVAPSNEPITLSEAKTHLRVDADTEDSLISVFIQAARETVEKYTNRSLVTQTRIARLDNFPCEGFIRVPNGPLISVTSISYQDENDATQTMSASLYDVDIYSDVPRIVIKNYWPSTYTKPNAVVITYQAGYGSASAIPAPLKSAILLILGHLYENREQVSDGGLKEIPFGAQNLMSSYVLEQTVVYHAYRTA